MRYRTLGIATLTVLLAAQTCEDVPFVRSADGTGPCLTSFVEVKRGSRCIRGPLSLVRAGAAGPPEARCVRPYPGRDSQNPDNRGPWVQVMQAHMSRPCADPTAEGLHGDEFIGPWYPLATIPG